MLRSPSVEPLSHAPNASPSQVPDDHDMASPPPPAAGRSGDRTVGRQRRRLLRQRAGGDDQRSAQGGSDAPSFVDEPARSRTGDIGLGGLVQSQTAAETDRKHPARGGRSGLLSAAGHATDGGVSTSWRRLARRSIDIDRPAIHSEHHRHRRGHPPQTRCIALFDPRKVNPAPISDDEERAHCITASPFHELSA